MRAHLNGIAALTPVTIDYYDTDVDADPETPYVVYTAPTFRMDSDVLSDSNPDVRDYFQATAAGTTAAQARWCQEQIRAALDGASPTVAGFSTHIKLSAPGVLAVDRDVTPYIFYATDTYLYRATPASEEGS